MPLSTFQKMGEEWGIREEKGNPATTEDGFAWIDESDYYFIKVDQRARATPNGQNRTLVLDNLIHGYFILGHPERLDYDYEHIYALVAYRAAKSAGKITLAPDSPPTTKKMMSRKTSNLPEQVFATETQGKSADGADSKSVDKNKDQAKARRKRKRQSGERSGQESGERRQRRN